MAQRLPGLCHKIVMEEVDTAALFNFLEESQAVPSPSIVASPPSAKVLKALVSGEVEKCAGDETSTRSPTSASQAAASSPTTPATPPAPAIPPAFRRRASSMSSQMDEPSNRKLPLYKSGSTTSNFDNVVTPVKVKGVETSEDASSLRDAIAEAKHAVSKEKTEKNPQSSCSKAKTQARLSSHVKLDS